MQEFRVHFPEEEYAVLNFTQDGLPGVASITSSLKGFAFKEIFGWHLSIIIPYEDQLENEMPTQFERDLIYELGDQLEKDLVYPADKPNALFLGRVTWGGEIEYIFLVHDPAVADQYLNKLIESKNYRKPFAYRMEGDPAWKKCNWLMNPPN